MANGRGRSTPAHPLRRARPMWLPRGGAPRRYPALAGRHEADVAIVGGGMTGALVTLEFAAAGVPV